MSSTFVISDIHGRYEKLLEQLVKHKITDKDGNRQLSRRHQVVSIGDLAHCAPEDYGDVKCLSLIGDVIDTLIVGNHEIPYFDSNNTFAGYTYDGVTSEILHLANAGGYIVPCILRGDVLISHAGLDERHVHHYPQTYNTAKYHHDRLHEAWNSQLYSYSAFDAIGYARGGDAEVGGILWCDFDDELISPFPQIVGHTPGGLRMKKNALCIDTGAKHDGTPTILEIDW